MYNILDGPYSLGSWVRGGTVFPKGIRSAGPKIGPDRIPYDTGPIFGPGGGGGVRGGPYSLREYGPPDRKLGRTVYPMTPAVGKGDDWFAFATVAISQLQASSSSPDIVLSSETTFAIHIGVSGLTSDLRLAGCES